MPDNRSLCQYAASIGTTVECTNDCCDHYGEHVTSAQCNACDEFDEYNGFGEEV